MRLLADENFPREAVIALRNIGHDVAWVREERPSIDDREVLEWANREARAILTQDKGFGELAFQSGLASGSGIVLFRVLPIPKLVAELAQRILGEDTDLKNRFIVVEPHRIRERSIP